MRKVARHSGEQAGKAGTQEWSLDAGARCLSAEVAEPRAAVAESSCSALRSTAVPLCGLCCGQGL
jgi:hypothetical protein